LFVGALSLKRERLKRERLKRREKERRERERLKRRERERLKGERLKRHKRETQVRRRHVLHECYLSRKRTMENLVGPRRYHRPNKGESARP